MALKKTERELIFLITSTLITVVVWVGLEVYRVYTKSLPPDGIDSYLSPLEPDLNVEVLDRLEKKQQ
ncbi:hypothetical protein A3D85_03100 [Candidatus Amesbacteria bacterium RIFCSPHIGHO2_02_FULL_47_9]|uniref:Uncharacterized protein n=1 Tax=Candidatus Amesbacteria bacterium RIFCSPHIGHO2_01_FULL_48_32b TaxID=1797253 RepID=A0A1F4YGH8_9BACT|nr:MAG: hypothetical protein A2876_00725 [Candidatus Amesbacteria bacterium RIFCSPHIGHO2_01_FULL_48_32b]OGD02248.1 MAG: hypothetical protein A3D85_03100 [Candidatus Amesbacteria bacterium RIFCSPHIGHO2_02_FULL_47_9]OGD07459.1 MAG: hypothetical protein A2899_04110 [Candidatus Amesbacteria bacterium RIFCSPLOWO2_01_FULL_49_25]